MEQKIFFQSSLPRSGSTLLQNIFAQNPKFYATPTSGMFELLYAARQNYTESPEFKAQDPELMQQAWKGFCEGALNGYFQGITDKPYVVDKSRAHAIHYDFINFFYPNPKIVVMVRDLRDVFASMEKNYRANQDKASPLINHAELRGTSTPKRIDIWANSQPVGMAIERLAEVLRQGLDTKMLFVRYEDLCLHPENEMRRIYEFLEVEHYDHDFDNIEQVTKEDDSVYGIFGDHKIRTKLEPTRSVAKELLGRDVTNWIWDTYKWFFDYFRYTK
jgi:sulfotransferase